MPVDILWRSQAWPQSSWIWEELELPGQGPVTCDRTIIKSPNICTSLHSNGPMNPAFTHPNQCNTMGFLVLFFQEVVFKKNLGKYIVRICQLITTFAIKWFPKVCGPCERGKSFKNCAHHRFEELSLWRLKCLDRHLKNESAGSKPALSQLTPCKPAHAQLTTCHLWPWQRSYQWPPKSKHWSLLKSVYLWYGTHFKNELFKQIHHDHSCKSNNLSVYKHIENFKMLTKLPREVLIQWVHFS